MVHRDSVKKKKVQQPSAGSGALCVISLLPPHANVARNATLSSTKVLAREMSRAALCSTWASVFERAAESFFSEYRTYLQITVDAIRLDSYRSLVGFAESRLCRLLLHIEGIEMEKTQFPTKDSERTRLLARVNPTWYKASKGENVTWPHSATLFVGVWTFRPRVPPSLFSGNSRCGIDNCALPPVPDFVRTRSKLLSNSEMRKETGRVGREWTQMIAQWPGWDNMSMAITIEHIPRSRLQRPALTQNTEATLKSAQLAPAPSNADIIDVAVAKLLNLEAATTVGRELAQTLLQLGSKPQKAHTKRQPGGKGKSREASTASAVSAYTSAEVLKLIRKSGVSRTDFQIVYEDRFVGLKATNLDQVSQDVTSDNFIPLHRVYGIKWRGCVVWEREHRVCFFN